MVDQADHDSGLRPGQQVATMMGGMGRSYDGSNAQYVTVPADQVIAVETSLPWDVVGALPEMFQTAYGSLTTGLDLQAGQTLLIRGGTSTVGLSAATMAKDIGATVISTTRHAERAEQLRAMGVDHPLVDDGKTDLPSQVFTRQLQAIADGRLQAPIAKTYRGLKQVRDAQAGVESAATLGKHVVLLDD